MAVYLSLLGVLAIGAFWRPELIAFAPFISLAGLESDRRWVRIVSYVGMVGFAGSAVTLVRLLR